MDPLSHVDESARRCERCGRVLYGGPACACDEPLQGEAAHDDGADARRAEGGAEDVREELAKWRRIREGAWVRRRVLTGDSGPLAPNAPRRGGARRARVVSEPPAHDGPGVGEDAQVPPSAGEEPVAKPPIASGPRRPSVVLGPPLVDDTAEVEALPLDVVVDAAFEPPGPRVGAIVLVALLIIVAAAGISWAIVVLS